MSEGQEQSQSQSIQISVESAGDPEFERRIFRSVASVGRQLGTVSDALEAVIAALPELPASEVLTRFAALRSQIEREKSERDIQRLASDPGRLVRALEGLRERDAAAYERYRTRLSEWLTAPPPSLPGRARRCWRSRSLRLLYRIDSRIRVGAPRS